MNNLTTAAQQALEALEFSTLDAFMLAPISPGRESTIKAITALRAALAEPVQEPIGYLWPTGRHPEFRFTQQKRDGVDGTPVYTAPPQRKPLTEEEILKAVGWDIAEMYMKLTPNFPVAEAKKETLKNARAIERAHGIGGKDE